LVGLISGLSDLSTFAPFLSAFFIAFFSFFIFLLIFAFSFLLPILRVPSGLNHGRSRHTIPNNRAMTQVPSAQPSAMKNPHTNQTNNALAEITGTIRRPPFDLAEQRSNHIDTRRPLDILTPGFESSYDSLKAGDLVLQDVDLMLSAINAIHRKLHVARFKPFQEMAKSGEFVSGGRFVHAQSFTEPVLDVFLGVRVTRQPQTTNAIRMARKVASSRLSDMLLSVACASR
jgi:hypothetical protein